MFKKWISSLGTINSRIYSATSFINQISKLNLKIQLLEKKLNDRYRRLGVSVINKFKQQDQQRNIQIDDLKIDEILIFEKKLEDLKRELARLKHSGNSVIESVDVELKK